jgi:hypothetical protein
MAYTYSALIAQGESVSGIQPVGLPPTGYLWVIRFMSVTYGSYIGYVQAALGLDTLGTPGPWAWLFSTPAEKLIGVRKQTSFWEGRFVVPPARTLYINVGNPDVMDYYVSGYLLKANYPSS